MKACRFLEIQMQGKLMYLDEFKHNFREIIVLFIESKCAKCLRNQSKFMIAISYSYANYMSPCRSLLQNVFYRILHIILKFQNIFCRRHPLKICSFL